MLPLLLLLLPDLVDAFFARIFEEANRVATWAFQQLPPDLRDALEAIDFSVFGDGLEIAQYLFPCVECLLVISGAYIAAGSIRLVRWVLAFVPTIGG